MKNLFLLFILVSISVFSQEKQPSNTTTIQNFGTVYEVDKPDLLLDKNTIYKVIFDIYTDAKNPEKANPLLTTVARFINMHTKTGVPAKNLQIAVVIHGKATKNVLSSASFKKRYEIDNPNTGLLAALKEANVAVYVCGQSYMYKKFKCTELNKNVNISLSALTALVKYQSEGYQLINFN